MAKRINEGRNISPIDVFLKIQLLSFAVCDPLKSTF
jgi:hypothetical protein